MLRSWGLWIVIIFTLLFSNRISLHNTIQAEAGPVVGATNVATLAALQTQVTNPQNDSLSERIIAGTAFSVSGMYFMVIHLPCTGSTASTSAVLAWAGGLLKA